MLEVYFGSDRKAVVDAGMLAAHSHGSEVTMIDEYVFVPGQLIDLVSADSLFGEASVYVLDTPSSQSDFNEACKDALEDMASSKNHFYILEASLLAGSKKQYAKHASKTEEFSADKAESFNVFGLADAFARRERRLLWLLIQEARLVGVREEEMIGILWWQIKSLRLASTTSSAEEAGMKDFPYRKAKQALSKFSAEELSSLARSLLELYHDGHKGLRDTKLALEAWALRL